MLFCDKQYVEHRKIQNSVEAKKLLPQFRRGFTTNKSEVPNQTKDLKSEETKSRVSKHKSKLKLSLERTSDSGCPDDKSPLEDIIKALPIGKF